MMAIKTTKRKPLIGFIGQGYIGKNYADDFEKRGFSVVRYSVEKDHQNNKNKIKECDIVFIAVPTPTKNGEFDGSIVKSVISLVGKGKIVVIKSTVLPGTAKLIQKSKSDIIVLNSPEFLSEATAAQDAAHPFSNIVGRTRKTAVQSRAAEFVLEILPKAPYSIICDSTEAELIKYAHNGSGYMQIVFFNLMYDLTKKLGVDWKPIEDAITHDPLIANRYARPLHKSGRGAGGNCFIKDFSALKTFYQMKVPKDEKGINTLSTVEEKNIELLSLTGKDNHILKSVYGEKITHHNPKGR